MANKMLVDEVLKAISSYREERLGLIGLIDRLMSLSVALTDSGYEWICDMDDFLLKVEIIYSLLASGDKLEYSQQDIEQINLILKTVESEMLNCSAD